QNLFGGVVCRGRAFAAVFAALERAEPGSHPLIYKRSQARLPRNPESRAIRRLLRDESLRPIPLARRRDFRGNKSLGRRAEPSDFRLSRQDSFSREAESTFDRALQLS